MEITNTLKPRLAVTSYGISMNLEEIYNKLKRYINQCDVSHQTDDSVSVDTKDIIYLHIARILNNNIGDNLFKPLY